MKNHIFAMGLALLLAILSIFVTAFFTAVLLSFIDHSKIYYEVVLGFGVVAAVFGVCHCIFSSRFSDGNRFFGT